MNLCIEELELDAPLPVNAPGTKNLTFATNEDGSEDRSMVLDYMPPCRFAICARCEGHGRHVNPAVDGNGITSEEWENDWDDDSREGYFSGRYDITCEAGCNDGKVAIPDYNRIPEALRAAVKAHYEATANYAAERAHERKMGY